MTKITHPLDLKGGTFRYRGKIVSIKNFYILDGQLVLETGSSKKITIEKSAMKEELKKFKSLPINQENHPNIKKKEQPPAANPDRAGALTAAELNTRKHITATEMKALIQHFGLYQKHLADECGLTINTFYNYMSRGDRPMPGKYMKIIIDYFIRCHKYGVSSVSPNCPSDDELSHPQHNPENQGKETDSYDHINRNFKHLIFAGIYFSPKNGSLGNALEEAGEYAAEVKIPVHVIHHGKNYKIECIGD